MALLIEVHYLPCIEYFCLLLGHDQIILEQHEHFTKQSYRNRCSIRGANQILDLRIPIQKGKSKTTIKDLKVDDSQPWKKLHWRSLQSAYGKAPFFEHYAPALQQIYQRPSKFLIEYTLPMLTLCLNWLQIDFPVGLTETYDQQPKEGIIDGRNQIFPKELYSNRPFYQPKPYPQVFGKDFADNLSIIDLIACEGPNARSVLNSSRRV